MGNKIKKFSQDAEYYYEKALDKSDNGDYVGCLEFLRRAQNLAGAPYCDDDLALRVEIADTYAFMGLYEESNREYYRLTAFDYALDEVYYGIIKNYAMLEMPEQAAYYLNFAVKSGILLPEDGFEPIDFSFLKDIEPPRIRLVKKDDNAHIVQAARQLLSSFDTVFARKVLETVPESSEQYAEASNYLALIEISDGNVEEGLKVCERLLADDPADLYALTTKILALALCERKAEAFAALAALDAVGFNTWPETAKVALCAAQIGATATAYKYLLRSLTFMPYDRELLLLHALAAANLGKIREAKDAAVRLQTIYPQDAAARYYAREIDKAQEGAACFELVPALPKEECARLGDILERALENAGGGAAKFVREMEKNEELNEAVSWGLYYSSALGVALGRTLARDPAGYSMVRELLVDPDFPVIPKKAIFAELLQDEKLREIQMSVHHQIQWYRPNIPKEARNKSLLNAYRKVYSALAFIDSDFDRKLNIWFKKLVEGYKKANVTEFSENAVAAVLAYKSRINKIFAQIPHACEVFGCTEEEFMLYYGKLNGESPQNAPKTRRRRRSPPETQTAEQNARLEPPKTRRRRRRKQVETENADKTGGQDGEEPPKTRRRRKRKKTDEDND